MSVANLGEGDFLAALRALLPRGLAWPQEDDGVCGRTLSGLSAAFATLHARVGDLSERESDPAQASELLAAWERAYGLPDPCVGDGQTQQERRAALVARIGASGGQSIAYYTGVAAALGYAITIQEFRPFRADRSTADSRVNDDPWPFTWRVNAPALTVIYFRADSSTAEEPIERASDQALECVLTRIKPAHTEIEFVYGS